MKRKLRFSILICCLFMLISGCQNNQADKKALALKNGQAKLAALSTRNLEEVNQAVANKQGEIKRQRRKAQQAANPNLQPNYVDMFSNTVIMGDSIADGLLDYRLLNSIQVVASRGKNVDMIDEDIQTVIRLAPTHIFMEYGMNDLQYFRQNTPMFIGRYKEGVQKLQAALPNTKIYINAILPIMQNAINRIPEDAGWPIFNTAIEEMCRELGVVYIDNSKILSDYSIGYNPDGIHPMYDYFPLWLEHMAEVAGL